MSLDYIIRGISKIIHEMVGEMKLITHDYSLSLYINSIDVLSQQAISKAVVLSLTHQIINH